MPALLLRLFMNTFTCEKCERTFAKENSDHDAQKEYDQSPWNIPGEDHGVVCEDCFKQFKIWFESLTEEDHKKIREKAQIRGEI